MKAAVVESGSPFVVREIGRPALPPGGALVRVTGCGICGSDLDKLFNRHLEAGTVLGHEVVGVIEALSDEACKEFPDLRQGQRVCVAHHIPCQHCYYCTHGAPSMCRAFKKTNIVPGGFCETIAVSREHLAHTVFPIPDDVTDSEASCIEPLACCVRAVERLPYQVGREVLVVGLGFIGLLTAQYLQLRDYHVFGIDLEPERVALAREHQMLSHASVHRDEVLAEISDKTEERGVDVVFLTVVNPATIELALKAIRDGGTLLLFSSFGKGEPILNQNDLYFRELTVLTSYSPSLQHLQCAYDLIVHKHIQVEPLMTHTYPLTGLNEAMESYRSGEALKVFVTL